MLVENPLNIFGKGEVVHQGRCSSLVESDVEPDELEREAVDKELMEGGFVGAVAACNTTGTAVAMTAIGTGGIVRLVNYHAMAVGTMSNALGTILNWI